MAIDSARSPDEEYMYILYGVRRPPSMRCTFRDKIIIPSAWV